MTGSTPLPVRLHNPTLAFRVTANGHVLTLDEENSPGVDRWAPGTFRFKPFAITGALELAIEFEEVDLPPGAEVFERFAPPAHDRPSDLPPRKGATRRIWTDGEEMAEEVPAVSGYTWVTKAHAESHWDPADLCFIVTIAAGALVQCNNTRFEYTTQAPPSEPVPITREHLVPLIGVEWVELYLGEDRDLRTVEIVDVGEACILYRMKNGTGIVNNDRLERVVGVRWNEEISKTIGAVR